MKRAEMIDMLHRAAAHSEIAQFEPETLSLLKISLLGAGLLVSVVASFAAVRYFSRSGTNVSPK